ncbi:zinc finger, CCHC-type containing protein [Tanacetum coccineum]
MLQEVKSWLGKCFSMKDLGEAAYIIGIKIYKDRSKRLTALSQNAYTDKIIKKFKMENSMRGNISMQEKPNLSKSQGTSTPEEVRRMQRVPYASVLGSIMYAVRYDNVADPFTNAMPLSKHIEHARMMRCIQKTSIFGRILEEINYELGIIGEERTIRLRTTPTSLKNFYSEAGDGVTDYTRRRHNPSQDVVTRSQNGVRLKERACVYFNQASNWLERLPARSITTWEDLTTRFLAQLFPPGRTAKLRNNILMFQKHHGESLSEAWTRFKDLLQKVPHHGIDLWLQILIFYDHVNPVKRRTIDQSAGGKLRDLNAKESWALLEDLAFYDNKSWNDPRDFAKPVKAIALPQDVPSTSDHRLI